jgi:hypothetical protein
MLTDTRRMKVPVSHKKVTDFPYIINFLANFKFLKRDTVCFCPFVCGAIPSQWAQWKVFIQKGGQKHFLSLLVGIVFLMPKIFV